MPQALSICLVVVAIAYGCAYNVPLNTHKLDFWDTNQVVGWPERPSPRAHHSITYLQPRPGGAIGGLLFIFGGIGTENIFLDDLHFYDTATRRWSGKVVRDWCCDEKGDVVNTARGYQPPDARAFHAAVQDENTGRLYILGGYSDQVGDLGDVQYFDPAQMKWSGPLDFTGPAPVARSGHVAFAGPDNGVAGGEAIYIFGGYSSTSGHLNDLYKLSLATDNLGWSEITTSRRARGGWGASSDGVGALQGVLPPRPSPRRHAAAAVFKSTSYSAMILVGGMRAPTAFSGPRQGSGNETDGSAIVFDDVWRLEFAGARVAWEKLDIEEKYGGLARFHHTCIAYFEGMRVVMTGGRSPNIWFREMSSTLPFHISPSVKITSSATNVASYTDEKILLPLSFTLNTHPDTANASWVPQRRQGSRSPADPCRTPSGITEAPLSLQEEGGEDSDGASNILEGRYGHAAAFGGGLMYEFGGFEDTGAVMEMNKDAEASLLDGGLRIYYFAEVDDGSLCPVWVETA